MVAPGSTSNSSSNLSPDENLYTKCYDLLISSYKMSYFYRLFSSDEYKYDYEGKSTPISTLLHSILIDAGIGTPYSDLMRIIENFITFIDNNNQVSAIGTLEFVDRLSKLNTVEQFNNNVVMTSNQSKLPEELRLIINMLKNVNPNNIKEVKQNLVLYLHSKT